MFPSRRVSPEPSLRTSRRAPPADFPTFELLKPHHRLQRLQRWLAAHCVPTLTLRDAATIAGLEPHYLSATFHVHVGVTFAQWTRDHRTAFAVRALGCGHYSIKEAAKLVGYDRRSLERAVRRATGKTPAEIQSEVEALSGFGQKGT